MGQLERYGLYVLVIVIFLILGVAIWGGDPAEAQPTNANLIASHDPSSGDSIENLDSSDRFQRYFVDPGALFEEIPARKPPETTGRDDIGTEQGGDIAGDPPQPQPQPQGQPPAPTPKPRGSGVRTHTIAAGDTLGGLSQQYYGTITKWQAIQAANPGISERKMPVGKRIVIPEIGQDAPAPVAVAGQTYTVRDGDSPAKISKRLFNTEKYAELIMRSNGIKDARKLRIGRVLTIPARPGQN